MRNTEPLPRTVSMLVVRDNKVLIFKHNKLNKLSIPAGKCEKGESPIKAFYREMNEELGLKVEDITMIECIYTHHKEFTNNGYVCELSADPINIETQSHEWMDWISIDALKEMSKDEISEITYSSLVYHLCKEANGGDYIGPESFGWVDENYKSVEHALELKETDKWVQRNFFIAKAELNVVYDHLTKNWRNYEGEIVKGGSAIFGEVCNNCSGENYVTRRNVINGREYVHASCDRCGGMSLQDREI